MKWEENVRRVVPYTAGEQPGRKGVIKLNTNENPYPPAPGVERRLRELETDRMRLYPPFPEQTKLASALGACYGIDTDRIFIGDGSDDVLSLAFQTDPVPGYHVFLLSRLGGSVQDPVPVRGAGLRF